MEFDQHLLFNFTSIIATVLFVSAAVITIVRKLKLRWPVRVNCWFCNNDTRIFYNNLDWWQCPSCEQFNGFTKDGDYAYEIPEQSQKASKTFAKPGTANCEEKKWYLCEDCNKKEELKICQLRAFEPNWFFHSKLQNFKKDLEQQHPLCENCVKLVDNVLQKQSRWLARYKMLFFKHKSVAAIVHNAKRMDKAVRIFLTMLTSAMMYYPSCWPLPFFGAFLQTGAFVINHAQKRSIDGILTLLWICISLFGPINKLNLFSFDIPKELKGLENIGDYHIVTILTVIIGIINVTSRSYGSRTKNLQASFKKLESLQRKENSPIGSLRRSDSFEEIESDADKLEASECNQSTSDIEIQTCPSTIHEPSKCVDLEPSSPNSFSSTTSTDFDVSNASRRHVLRFDGNSEHTYSLNDSLGTLKTLTLGESRSMLSPRSQPRVFKTRVYGSTSPDLFQRSNTRKLILAPPKLNLLSQTSWVAGGYWQVNLDTPSLSRSSSQSSGFGSTGSNFGPSREPSVSKDIDKCSVFTENTQFCYASRPNSASSTNSCCQHSTIPYTKYENPPIIYHQPVAMIPNSLYARNPQSHFSPVQPELPGCYEGCLSVRNQSMNSSFVHQNTQVPNYNIGYPSGFVSPVWLPVLVCGSLVFNILVFCTMLLR